MVKQAPVLPREEWVQRYVRRVIAKGSAADLGLLEALASAEWERLGHLHPDDVADEDWEDSHPSG